MKTGGIHRRMLDICCPGLYPGVLLWPICHPTYFYFLKAFTVRLENDRPLTNYGGTA